MADYDFPAELRYTEKDEWARRDGDRLVVGITDYAQEQLGDVVFVDLKPVGTALEAEGDFGAVESVKAVSELYTPVAGTLVAINEALADQPELVNESCYGDGWMVAIEPADPAAFEALMDAAAYAKHVAARED